ncbi:MAG: hypothetical protein LBL80_05920 [Ruminococcus sp.]|jgi:hypothetical protein|nr:hypothetical protein [Ruminococcus sp.]
MAELIAGGYNLSPLIEDNSYSIRRINIYEDTDTDIRAVAGYKIEIIVKLKGIKEAIIADIRNAVSSETVPVTYTFCGEQITSDFPRPEIELTAVSEYPEGIYWDGILRFMSGGFYPSDCL